MLIKDPHNLGRIHCGTAAHCNDYVRLKVPHKLCASLCIGKGRVWLYIREHGIGKSHLVETVCDNMGISILIQEGVGYDECPLLAHYIL